MFNPIFATIMQPTPFAPTPTRTTNPTPTPTSTLPPTPTPSITPSSLFGSLLLSEDWQDSAVAQRGWTDGTSYFGTGYNIVYDSTLAKNVLEIAWDGSDAQPRGATSLQHYINVGSIGATLYTRFAINTVSATDYMSHYLRFLQNWYQNWGGMGPSPNQINVLEIGPSSSRNSVYDPITHRNIDVYRSPYYTGGTYGSYCAMLDSLYTLTNDQWYDYRAYAKPQIVAGESTGTIVIDIKRITDTAWTRIVNANNVQLSDMSGTITKFAVGPYRTLNTANDRFKLSTVEVYYGNYTKP